MNIKYDYIVIGAGAAGLSFSALMEKKGFKVALLEAHSLPGGCSSYFEREGFIFDAGATTLSGFKKGRPLEQLFKELDLDLEIVEIDPGIISVIDDKKIRRFRNLDKWIAELSLHFPNIAHEKLWKKLKKIEIRGWDLSISFKNIPIRNIRSLSSFFSLKVPGAFASLPCLFKSVGSLIKKLNITDSNYLKMIDELLFITAQNTRFDTPLLMGAMGLCYPDDTAYAMGGMKAFSKALASKCSNVFYKNRVEKIIARDDYFEVQTSQAIFLGTKIISTLPIWNHASLFDDRKAKAFFSEEKIPDPKNCWSAFMIYLTIPLDEKREGIYYQIHCDKIPNCSTSSFFVSLSHPKDKTRSINGRQVVTISTHTKYQEWTELDKEEYKNKKKETESYILDLLKIKFDLLDTDLQNIMTGSPKTFIKYTRRFSGLVGGIPHSLKRNPLNYMFAKSPYRNFYMIGDTQFPGQGIAAVVMSSMNLVDHLK